MKNNLTQYLEKTYHNTASRECIKIILKSKTEDEYIRQIKEQITKNIREITKIKQSICVMDQFVTYLYFNEEAHDIEGFADTLDFYMTESNKLCHELRVKNQFLYDCLDILAIAIANSDMNGALIDSENQILKQK